jgi:hypothetical protein
MSISGAAGLASGAVGGAVNGAASLGSKFSGGGWS